MNYKCDIDPKTFPDGKCPQFFKDKNGYTWQYSNTNFDGKCCYVLIAGRFGRRRKKKVPPTPPCPTICVVAVTTYPTPSETIPCSGNVQTIPPEFFFAPPNSGHFEAQGGTAPFIFTVTSGTFPTNFTLNPNGTFTQTGASQGIFNFSITATDANGCTGTQMFTVTLEF